MICLYNSHTALSLFAVFSVKKERGSHGRGVSMSGVAGSSAQFLVLVRYTLNKARHVNA